MKIRHAHDFVFVGLCLWVSYLSGCAVWVVLSACLSQHFSICMIRVSQVEIGDVALPVFMAVLEHLYTDSIEVICLLNLGKFFSSV